MSVIPGRPPYNTPNFGLPVPGGEEDADGVSAVDGSRPTSSMTC